MADWPPDSGATLATVSAVTVTASGTANTKGAYTQLATSTGFLSPLIGVIIQFNTEAAYLVDIAFGAAGSEVVVLADLHYSGRTDVPLAVSLPLAIPQSTRVAVRIQSSVASATAACSVQIFGGWQDQPVPRNIFTTYGSVPATSLATQIDPGSSGVIGTKGAWVQVTSSTTRSHKGLLLAIGNQNNLAAAACAWQIDVGIGAPGSEVVLVSNYRVAASTADTILPSPSPIYPQSIPAGSALSVRAGCNNGTSPARLIGVVLYGIT